jgi:hypothetical protein
MSNHNNALPGFQRANQLTINKLRRKLDKDAGCDLTKLLQHEATSYPVVRKALGDAAAQSPEVQDEERLQSMNGQVKESHPWVVKLPVQIVQPLSDIVVKRILPSYEEHMSVAPLRALDAGAVDTLNERLSSGRQLWTLLSSVVLEISSEIVVKASPSLDLDHIPTMEAIKSYAPSLPIPDVLGVIKASSLTYIFLAKAEGISLDRIWGDLEITQKISIREQLESIFSILRGIPYTVLSPKLAYGGGLPPLCKDARRRVREAKETITTEDQFNQFICREDNRSESPWIRMIRSSLKNDHKAVFTHGDLHPRNIIVNLEDMPQGLSWTAAEIKTRNIKITGLLDWEFSGIYPEHWEYIKALNTIGPKDPMQDWIDYLPIRSIGTWPQEFAIDTLISRWLG